MKDADEILKGKKFIRKEIEKRIDAETSLEVWLLANLPGLKFTRTKTIGTGGDCCDFKMELIHQTKANGLRILVPFTI